MRLVAPGLAAPLDFETATSLDKEHLTALARGRVQDKLRRVERKTGELRNGRRPYVLVLMEFQSKQDPDMAWRMREYLYLVEAGLRETGTMETEGVLPELLSIVVHNGRRPWRASAEWGPLTGDGPAGRVRMYATVDLQVLAAGPDAEGRELAPGSRLAALAELEAAPARRLPKLLLRALRRYHGPESEALRRGLHLRVDAALRHLGMAAPPPLEDFERALAKRRGEQNVTGMMEANLERWQEANVAEGMKRGLREGEARGLREGEAQGRVALLRRMTERRFGIDVAGRVAALLGGETDVARLDAAGDWLIECETGEALLARLRAEGRMAGNGASG